MYKIFVFCLLLAVVRAEVPVTTSCDEVDANACTISEIRVVPCKKPSNCKLTKGREAAIEIDFTPNFTSDKLLTGMFWAAMSGDLPFNELENADACNYATCPFEVGQPNKFKLNLRIGKKLPNGKFLLKWKLWDEANQAQACCLKFNVELKK